MLDLLELQKWCKGNGLLSGDNDVTSYLPAMLPIKHRLEIHFRVNSEDKKESWSYPGNVVSIVVFEDRTEIQGSCTVLDSVHLKTMARAWGMVQMIQMFRDGKYVMDFQGVGIKLSHT